VVDAWVRTRSGESRSSRRGANNLISPADRADDLGSVARTAGPGRRGPGAPVFTKAYGRRMKQGVGIPLCVKYQAGYDQSRFPPDVAFDLSGRW
jgi:hypothetical protein